MDTHIGGCDECNRFPDERVEAPGPRSLYLQLIVVDHSVRVRTTAADGNIGRIASISTRWVETFSPEIISLAAEPGYLQ